MVKKRSDTSRPVDPPESDNFKLINGIGPAVEHRLHGVGIRRYAQLAALSPADIAASVSGLAGLTAERITRQDWIGQARKLAARSASTERESSDVIPVEPQRTATFSLEFSLNEDNTVRRSRISHLQSGFEETWDGWQDAQLIGFLVQHAGLVLPSSERPIARTPVQSEPSAAVDSKVESHLSTAEEAEVSPPKVTPPRLFGVLHLSDLGIMAADSQEPQHFIPQGQPFNVRLTLDLADITVPSDEQLSYKATIYSKRLDGRPPLTIGEESGIVTLTDRVTLNVKGKALSRGAHRVHAVATLQPVTKGPTAANPGTTAAIDGDLLVIF
ncbi:MAG TPA: hypothetical protein VKR83_09835 [Ktedonobacteraceae bacterium]|nr:hypothetical protein [Ktedonobacteraceae bacterium]